MAREIMDNRKSVLNKKEIAKFKSESMKIVNSPVVLGKETLEVASFGAIGMREDKFVMIKDKLDV